MNLRNPVLALLLVGLLVGCASFTPVPPEATPVVLLDFETAPLGVITGEYALSGKEVVPPGTKVFPKKFGRDANGKPTDGPEIVAGGATGKQSLSVQSGRRSEGLVVDLPDGADGNLPFPPGSVTIEFVFQTRGLNPPGNAFGFQYLGGNEWPNGARFAWSFRTAVDQMLNFVSFHGKETRLPIKEQIVAEKWYHVAGVLVYNNANPAESTLRFYLDGKLQDEKLYDASQDVSTLNGSNTTHGLGFSVGYSYGQDANGGDHRGLDGLIDAMAVTLEPLEPGQFVLTKKR